MIAKHTLVRIRTTNGGDITAPLAHNYRATYGVTIANGVNWSTIPATRITSVEPVLPAGQPQPFADYYVFQFLDGTWRIAPATEHEWNGRPDLPRDVADSIHEHASSARSMLGQFAARAVAAS